MLTVVCVLRQSQVFNAIWVERLKRQVVEHINPTRFVCISDVEVPCERIPLTEPWPHWWGKIMAFKPGLFHGPTILFDLDTLILRPLPGLGENVHRLMLLDDFFQPKRPASGIVMWRPSPATERIYEEFKRDPKAAMATRHGDGGFIGKFPHDRIQKAWPGMVGSYKANRLQNGPGGFAVICQHGRPKFNDLPDTHWMVRAWIGKLHV